MPLSLSANLRSALARIPRPSALQDAAFAADQADPDDSQQVVVVDQRTQLVEDEPGMVPDGIRVAAAWSWRLMLIGAGIYFLFRGLDHLDEVTIPFVVSLLLSAAFWPIRDALVRHKVRPGLAAFLCILLLAVVVLGIISLVSVQIATQWDALSSEAVNSFKRAVSWTETGPLHLTNSQIDNWLKEATDYVTNSRTKIAEYAATVGSQLSRFFAGVLLMLFSMFYFLFEGRKLASGASVLVPRRSRQRVMDSATRGWFALVAYVRAAVIVAACDGLGAMIGALCLGSAMWLAIGALTFLFAFIPLIGAFFSGAVSVGVIFVTLGPIKAIIMLAVFLAVIELEGHVMQPFLLGKAVSIHPLVVLFGIATGMIIGGPVGALFTVPLMAFANAFIRGWNRPRRRPATAEEAHSSAARIAKDAEQADDKSEEAGLADVARNAAEASSVEREEGEQSDKPAG